MASSPFVSRIAQCSTVQLALCSWSDATQTFSTFSWGLCGPHAFLPLTGSWNIRATCWLALRCQRLCGLLARDSRCEPPDHRIVHISARHRCAIDANWAGSGRKQRYPIAL